MPRRSITNASFITSSDVLSRLLGFVVTTYLARVLGVENLGAIGFAMAALSYGLIATDLGLLKLGTREVAKRRECAGAYAAGILGLRLILAFIALTGLGVFAVLMPKPDPMKFMVMSYALALLPAALTLDWLFQGIEEIKHIGVSRLLLYVCYLALVLAFVHQPGHVFRVPLLWAASNLLAAIYLIIVYRVRIGRLGINLSLSLWGQLLRAALPLGAGTVLGQVYMSFGTIALGLQAGNAQTGLYTAAFRIVYFVLIVDRVFYTVVFPIVARRVGQTAPENLEAAVARARQTMQQLARLVLLIALPVAFFGMALAGPVIGLVYGNRFAGAAPVLAITVWLVVTTTLNSLYAYGLIAFRRDKEFARNVSVGTLVILVLSVILVAWQKAVGAGIALVAGEAVMLAFMYRGFQRQLKVNLLAHLPKPLIASAALAAGLYWLSPSRLTVWLGPAIPSIPGRWLERACLVLLLTLALAIYSGIMYLVKGVSKEDIALLRTREAS